MKKALVILLAIFMVGAAFAADVVAPTFSGSVSATWGVDLEDEASGFKNESDVKVTFPFAAFGDKAQGGEVMYGEITVKDFGLSIDTKDGVKTKGDNFAISGKIHFGNGLYMGVYGKPSLEYNFAENLRKGDPGVQYLDVNTNNDWIGATGGIELGYSSDLASVAFKTASKGDWDKAAAKAEIKAKKDTPWSAHEGQDAADADTTYNPEDRYMYQVAATLKPVKDLLTIDVAYTLLPEGYFKSKMFNTLNAKVAVKAGGLEASLGADAAFYDKGDSYVPAALENTMAIDFAPAVSYAVVDGFKVGVKGWGCAVPMKDSKADIPFDMDVYVEEEMDKGFVAPLSAKLTFGIDKLLGDKDYFGNNADTSDDFKYKLSAEAAYKVLPGLKVSANTSYNYKSTLTLGGGIEAGADFHKIANTTFAVNYADFQKGKEDSDFNKGKLTVSAKIAF